MMPLAGVKTVADVRALMAERAPRYVKVGVFDMDGVMRGKYMSQAKFLSALEKGFGFCDVVLDWDSADRLYDNAAYTGWHTGYPDARYAFSPRAFGRFPSKTTRSCSSVNSPERPRQSAPANGRSANFVSISPIGSCNAISRSSEAPVHARRNVGCRRRPTLWNQNRR